MKTIGKVAVGAVGIIAALYLLVLISAWLYQEVLP